MLPETDSPIVTEWAVSLDLLPRVETLPRFEKPLTPTVREVRLLCDAPWVRSLGKLEMELATAGWKFPLPPAEPLPPREPLPRRAAADGEKPRTCQQPRTIRPRPTGETVLFKDRLLYLLQPPLEDVFSGRQVSVPFQPFPYQLEGIAFLMPRHAALLADEMGLGKTAQVILAMRLLFHAGLIRRALIVCPKPLVNNWTRELKSWAEDVPFEVIGGDTQSRRASWLVSKAPLKLVNYEVLTRDAEIACRDELRFDLVVLDEAQRIKNRDNKTAQAACALRRDRSWAMSGTPIENRPEDLINLFEFIDPGRVPPDTPAKRLSALTSDCILRRTKESVATDLPPRVIRDVELELTPEQKHAYAKAETEGVVQLNQMGETITVQHVFELVMRLKQICNFDPATGASAKLERLLADLTEVAESNRKAIVFSQWVEPLEVLARALKHLGALTFHGKTPSADRPRILDQFRNDPDKHVILMSYGTGSVGLNLQFCNYVFLFDRWWNPAIEDQAINRAHRLGQKETVFVTRFLAAHTIEGRIADVLDKKRQLFQEVLGQNGPPASLGLSQEEIFGLFDIRRRPRPVRAA